MSVNVLSPKFAKPYAPGWANRSVILAEIILNRRPDIVALQEATDPQSKELAAMLPGYKLLEPRFLGVKGVKQGLAWLILRDVWDVMEVGPSSHGAVMPWTSIALRSLVDSQRRLRAVNLHLSSTSLPERLAGAASVSDQIKVWQEGEESVPILVLGDFNADATTDEYARLAQGEVPLLRDAHRVAIGQDPDAARASLESAKREYRVRLQAAAEGVAMGEASEGFSLEKCLSTFHGYAGLALRQIDHIMYKNCREVVGAEVVWESVGGIYPSDHFAILATFNPW